MTIIKNIFTNVCGEEIFTDTAILSRLHAVGEEIVLHSIWYTVKRVAIYKNSQIINLQRTPAD